MEELKAKFSKIYDQYIYKIYRFIYLKVNSQDLAEDLTSEVFVEAWESYVEKEAQIENVQAYIYRIARNVLADHYRKNTPPILPLENQELEDPEDPLSEQANAILEMERIKKALLNLNDEYQNFIIWRYLDELSIPEIAQITGKTEENVRVGIHRALNALKAHLV